MVILEYESLKEQYSLVMDNIFLHPCFVFPDITFSFTSFHKAFIFQLFVIFIFLARGSSFNDTSILGQLS